MYSDPRILLSTALFFLLTVLLPGLAQPSEGLKVGVVDTQWILDQSKAGKRAKRLLEEHVKSRQRIIDLEEEELRRLEEKLASQGAVLSEEARRRLQGDFQGKFLRYQRKVAALNKEIQDKRAEILMEFNQGLVEIVRRIAQKEQYTIMLDKTRVGEGPILYAEDALDLTSRVLEEYDKAFP